MADLSLDGLASGMPTENTINQILNAEYGTKLQNLNQEKSNLETQKNAWRDVNSRIDKLEQKVTQLKLSSTFASNKTTSSDEEVVTATSTTDATEGTYDIEVVKKALAHRIAGTDQSAKIDSATSANSEDISEIAMQNGGEYTATQFSSGETIDGTTYDYGLKNSDGNIVAVSTNQQVYTSLDKATAEGDLGSLTSSNLGESYDFGSAIANNTVVRMDGTGANEKNNLATAIMMNDDTVTINGTDISVSATDTLEDFVIAVNDSDAGVNASTVSNRLILESNETGTDNEITLSDNGNSNGQHLLEDLGLIDGSDNIITSNDGYQAAQNAEVTVNGITGITSQDNTIDEAVSNVTFEISDAAQPSQETETATVTVSQDTEKATSKIQAFVDQYNSVQDFMNKKLDYNSETEESGALQGDGTLMRLQSRLRQLVMEQVDSGNEYNSLMSVGISSKKNGTLEFDSGKFETALKEKPEQVKNLFTSEEDDGSFDGVATKLDSYLDMVIQTNIGVIPGKIDSYERMMEDVEQSIASTNDRLEQERERLTQEFTSMEQSISEMNNQMSWMQSQLGSMGGTSNMLSSMM
ncbi:flagellar filament capping protein FliD [Acetohalobium arabaticum]|uniref:Flagellar hook-associated protein 2 n=1 Tax=Acetohalobium arabaticum (strain ATCC 49924 / DSM 5501 / Z-7288) TaxID=574087 RepID=D9QTN9_ACEAZ|nr:flagellar filament capping protein FliD [Acetohalobium arabaticum]ADL11803.1 flagellar hook-associated 2 domain protein [Acetohalobium arabaticum DSM 5501]